MPKPLLPCISDINSAISMPQVNLSVRRWSRDVATDYDRTQEPLLKCIFAHLAYCAGLGRVAAAAGVSFDPERTAGTEIGQDLRDMTEELMVKLHLAGFGVGKRLENVMTAAVGIGYWFGGGHETSASQE